MSVTMTQPSLEEVLEHIPTYPNYINIRPLARALKVGGDRSPYHVSRIRRRLDSALEQGLIIKKLEFGIAKYWKPSPSPRVAIQKAPAIENPISSFIEDFQKAKDARKSYSRKVQVELIKFVEFLLSTHRATNQGQLQEEFLDEALQVLMFALNYRGAADFTEKQGRELLALWKESGR